MTDVMNALYLKNCSHLNRHFYMIRAYTICNFSQLYQVLHQNNETYDMMIFQKLASIFNMRGPKVIFVSLRV